MNSIIAFNLITFRAFFLTAHLQHMLCSSELNMFGMTGITYRDLLCHDVGSSDILKRSNSIAVKNTDHQLHGL